MLNIYTCIYNLYVSVFVTPPSGISFRYLLKNYMLLQCCDVDCAVKYKV